MTNESSNRPPEPGPEYKTRADKREFRMPPLAMAGLLALVVALASIGYLRTSFGPNSEAAKTSSAGLDPLETESRKAVDDFNLTDATGGTTPFSAYKGNVVILTFWASWCTPCLVELPTFAEIGKRFHAKGLRIVPVNVDEADTGIPFARVFWDKKNFVFPSFFDAGKDVARKFKVDMLPATFVIDRQSRIVFTGFGANDWSDDETVETIESLLEEK